MGVSEGPAPAPYDFRHAARRRGPGSFAATVPAVKKGAVLLVASQIAGYQYQAAARIRMGVEPVHAIGEIGGGPRLASGETQMEKLGQIPFPPRHQHALRSPPHETDGTGGFA